MLTRMISRIRRRIQLEWLIKGLAILLASFLISSLAASILLSQFNFSDSVILGTRILGGLFLVGIFFHFLIRPSFRPPSSRQVARFLEERHPELQERLSTAVELEAEPKGVHPEIRRLIQKDARQLYLGIRKPRFYFPRASFSSAVAVVIALLVFSALFWSGPGFYNYSLTKIFRLWNDDLAPLYSLQVTPGSVKVGQHSDVQVRAQLEGFDSERVALFVRYENEPQWEVVRMRADVEKGGFSFLFFDVRDPFEYYVEADGIRSETFRVDVSEVPRIEKLTVELDFPKYTGLESVQQEDQGDVRAVKGTLVRFNVKVDQPVRSGMIKLDSGPEIALEMLGPRQLRGQFKVEADDFYRIHLEDLEGVSNPASDEYIVQALTDQPPVLTFRVPGRDRKVTNIEEVYLEIKAGDDYGIRRLSLFYSLNGDPEQELKLGFRRGSRSFTTSHVFFMEEFELQPGDFVSYYARAHDAVASSTTDIYFFEVEPFDRNFTQAQQGGQGKGEQGPKLAKQQKQIISATFKLKRDKADIPASEFEESGQTLALVQQQLQIQTKTIVERIERRGAAASDPRFKKMIEYLNKAMSHMEPAHDRLNQLSMDEALPEEQKSYQNLLRAEALFNDIQLAFGDGSNAPASAEQLADLVDLELDRKKNQYETLQQNRAAQQEQQLDETLEKLKELARRQEQQIERQQRQARQQSRSGGAASSSDQLIQEAEKLARELERLSRQKRDPKLSEVGRQLRQAIREMRQSQSAKPGEQQMRAQQALERLQEAQRRLGQQRQDQLERTVNDLKNRSQELNQRQQEVIEQVENLRQKLESRQVDQEFLQKRRELIRGKDELRQDLEKLEGDLHQAARQMTSSEPESARKLKEAAIDIRDDRIGDQMLGSQSFLNQGWFDQAKTMEKGVARDLDDLAETIQEAEEALGSGRKATPQERLQRAQQELGSLLEDLQSLEERARAASGEKGKESSDDPQKSDSPGQEGKGSQQDRPGQQPGQEGKDGRQPGQGRGQQGQGQKVGQDGRQDTASPSQAALSGRSSPANSSSSLASSTGINPRQVNRELQERRQTLEKIRRLVRDNPELAKETNRLLRNLRKVDAKRLFNDPEELARLRSQVIDGLHQLELEINRSLLESADGRLRLANPDEIPDKYRRNVEEYYRSLATRKK